MSGTLSVACAQVHRWCRECAANVQRMYTVTETQTRDCAEYAKPMNESPC